MTPPPRPLPAALLAHTPAELAAALLHQLRELTDDTATTPENALELSRYEAARAHAAAIVELCPMPPTDVAED